MAWTLNCRVEKSFWGLFVVATKTGKTFQQKWQSNHTESLNWSRMGLSMAQFLILNLFIWTNIKNKKFNSRCVYFLWELNWYGESSYWMLFNAKSTSSHEVSNFICNIYWYWNYRRIKMCFILIFGHREGKAGIHIKSYSFVFASITISNTSKF